MADATARGTGCYKCGRPGHWSRDCPSAPASTTMDRTPAEATRVGAVGNSSQSTQGYKRKDPPGYGGRSIPGGRGKAVVEKPRHRGMPKLTPELLLSADGLGYVLEKIPRQVTIKGRGHEVEDLKSLLESYVRWHSQLLPYFSYSQFVEKVEKLGVSKRVRMTVRELREKIARGEKPESADVNFEACQGDLSPDAGLDIVPATEGDISGGWSDEGLPAEDHADPPIDVLDEYLHEASGGLSLKQTDSSPAQVFRPTLLVGPEPDKESEQVIKEEQRARMEANKLKALERARARRLEVEKLNSTLPA